ncbi:hypothetical protein [Arthrobacter castelli]|uniref:hypothetical protein n=1 Tax=Arthrobacter castelli TaxID=271431 RepID=UPI001FE1D712|nr:hypothetical protein [Arthrobacter castelli]
MRGDEEVSRQARPGIVDLERAPRPHVKRESGQYGGPRIRLGRRMRYTVLTIHILSAGAWIGIDVMVAVLVTVGWFGQELATRGAAYQILGEFVVVPMMVSALLCAATGLILGIGTSWGLLRYRWVLAKLVITFGLCTLIVVALRPRIGEVALVGMRLGRGGAVETDLAWLFFPPAVSLVALSLALMLAVFKPWGRTRRMGRHVEAHR